MAPKSKRDTRQKYAEYPASVPEFAPPEYNPPLATRYTIEERQAGKNLVTSKCAVDAWIEHPEGVVVEYPETSSVDGEAVLHVFHVEPDTLRNPRNDAQYSLGGTQGTGQWKTDCRYLSNIEGVSPVKCTVSRVQCEGVKCCTYGLSSKPSSGESASGVASSSHEPQTHHYTTPALERQRLRDQALASQWSQDSAEQEVFNKTLALACALKKHGCAYDAIQPDGNDSLEQFDFWDEIGLGEEEPKPIPLRSKKRSTCKGRIVIRYGSGGKPYLACEHRNKLSDSHFVLRSLTEYDLPYLTALLSNNTKVTSEIENRARSAGYGPTVPCTHVFSNRQQAQFCPNWHRADDGTLSQFELSKSTDPCPSAVTMYIPEDLEMCPKVLMVCRNPHNHTPPPRTKTPRVILDIFINKLRRLGWKLADTTPRRLERDDQFVEDLKHTLRWSHPAHPSGPQRKPLLSDLHPSMQNLDKVQYIIDEVIQKEYPDGTDWKALEALFEHEKTLPPEERYVRCMEEFTISTTGEQARLAVCMFPEQSEILLNSKWPSGDTSFKRVRGYYEFELESWNNDSQSSLALCRAFVTSLTAEAHLKLLTRIFQTVEQDTNQVVKIKYIHGSGYEIFTFDEHKGQALGFGQWLQKQAERFAQENPESDEARHLASLGPYDQLAYILRLCTIHFDRNIRKIKDEELATGVSSADDVRRAMYSLSSAEPLHNLEQTLDIIRKGGSVARQWLDDKLVGSSFALPALYQPLSKIDHVTWSAGRSHSNGVEQAHRSVNRFGLGLSLLGGVSFGREFDSRQLQQRHVQQETGIRTRYTSASHIARAERAVTRNVAAGKKTVKHKASNARNALATLQDLHSKAIVDVQNYLKRPTEAKKKKLETLQKKYDKAKGTYQRALDLSGTKHGEVFADPFIGARSSASGAAGPSTSRETHLSNPESNQASSMLPSGTTEDLSSHYEAALPVLEHAALSSLAVPPAPTNLAGPSTYPASIETGYQTHAGYGWAAIPNMPSFPNNTSYYAPEQGMLPFGSYIQPDPTPATTALPTAFMAPPGQSGPSIPHGTNLAIWSDLQAGLNHTFNTTDGSNYVDMNLESSYNSAQWPPHGYDGPSY